MLNLAAHLAAGACRCCGRSGVEVADPAARGGRAGVTLAAACCCAGSACDAATASMTATRSGVALCARCAAPPAAGFARGLYPGLAAKDSVEEELCGCSYAEYDAVHRRGSCAANLTNLDHFLRAYR